MNVSVCLCVCVQRDERYNFLANSRSEICTILRQRCLAIVAINAWMEICFEMSPMRTQIHFIYGTFYCRVGDERAYGLAIGLCVLLPVVLTYCCVAHISMTVWVFGLSLRGHTRPIRCTVYNNITIWHATKTEKCKMRNAQIDAHSDL